jgi:hypothetical protein
VTVPGPPFLEYGGLTSVPGPFECSDVTIYLFGLRADPDLLADLCATVLHDPDGTMSYTPLGEFVMLSFGSMVVRSLSQSRSPLFGTAYADMGTSAERHAAIWVPTAAGHRADHADLIDRISLFIPAMWVDNPVSLLGGRDIYGIAKQWGEPTITTGDRPSCSLDVFGGAFGRDETSGLHPLLELTPQAGVHVGEAVEELAAEAGRIAGDALGQLLRGTVTLPDEALFREAAAAVAGHQLRQVGARQFRTSEQDGLVAGAVELVELTTTFGRFHARLLRHGFDFTLHTLASHPLGRTLGLSSQTVPFGLEVTGQFVLTSA